MQTAQGFNKIKNVLNKTKHYKMHIKDFIDYIDLL